MLSKRTLESMLFFLLISIMWSPYISSWFPKINFLPLGPIIRDFAILFFYSLILFSFFKVRHFFIVRVHLYVILIFFAYILISITLNDSTSLQIILGLHAFVFYPMVFSFLYFYFLNNKNIRHWYASIKYLKNLITYLLIIASVIAIIDVITNGYFTLILGYDPNYGGDGFMLITRYYDLIRANGGFADALAFGYLMVVGFIFFLYKIITSSTSTKYIDILGTGLTALAVVLSITRGAIIALLFVFIIFLYKSKVLIWIPVLILSGIIVISISLSSYSDVFIGRFTDSDKGSRTSTNLRYEMAMDSIDYLSQKPMGVGLGTQGAGSTLTNHDERINTDNFVFHCMLELGLLGGTLFILFIFSQFRIFYLASKGRRKFFLSLLMLFSVSALFSSSLQSGILSVFFWLVCLIIAIDSYIVRMNGFPGNNMLDENILWLNKNDDFKNS